MDIIIIIFYYKNTMVVSQISFLFLYVVIALCGSIFREPSVRHFSSFLMQLWPMTEQFQICISMMYIVDTVQSVLI